MDVFITLAIVLFFAKVGGYISKKLGQPSEVGEVIVGMILGPGMLGIFQQTDFFTHFADLGIIMLMFLIGLKFDLGAFEKFLKGGIMTAVFGAFLPFFGGILLGAAVFHWPTFTTLIFSAVLMTTSITVAVTVLEESGKLRTPLGYTLIDAAIADNIIGIAMLSLVIGIAANNSASILRLGFLGVEIILFFAAIILIGPAVSRFALKFGRHLDLRVKEGHLSMILIVILALTFIAHSIGLSVVIGAFLAGVLFKQDYIKGIKHEIYSMTCGLFIPVFFAYIGSFILPSVILRSWLAVLLIVAVALGTKFFGSMLGAVVSNLSGRDAVHVGIGMMGRCEVALVIALLAKDLGLFTQNVYTVIVASAMITVVITQILLKQAVRR